MLEFNDIEFFDPKNEQWRPSLTKTLKEEASKTRYLKREKERKEREAKKRADLQAAQEAKSPDDIAASKLKSAKLYIKKNEAEYRKRLQEIVDKFSESKSADEAKSLLDGKK